MSPMFTRVALVATVALTAGLGVSTSANATTTTDDCTAPFAHTQASGEVALTPAADHDSVLSGDGVTIDVLHNDLGHDLSVVGVSQGELGYSCVNSDSTVNYYAAPGQASGTDTFEYAVTDGSSYQTATVTVTIEGVKALQPKLTSKLVVKKGKVTKQAKVTFTNTNTRTVEIQAGNFGSGKAPAVDKKVAGGAKLTFSTKLKLVNYVVFIKSTGTNFVYVVDGTLNTRTGKVTTSQNSGRHAGSAARTWVR